MHFFHIVRQVGIYFHSSNLEMEALDGVGGPEVPSQNAQATHSPKHFGFQSKREISQVELVSAL